MPALPFCGWNLIVEKPSSLPYPKELITLGDHLKKRRLDLGLLQKEVANLIGVDKTTVHNWERNRNEPELKHLPRIFNFLGYVPYDPVLEPHQKLIVWRTSAGLSRLKLAEATSLDETTIARWEAGISRPRTKLLERVKDFFYTLSKKRQATL